MNFFCYLYTNSCLSWYHNLPLAGNEVQLMLHHRVFLYLVFCFFIRPLFFRTPECVPQANANKQKRSSTQHSRSRTSRERARRRWIGGESVLATTGLLLLFCLLKYCAYGTIDPKYQVWIERHRAANLTSPELNSWRSLSKKVLYTVSGWVYEDINNADKLNIYLIKKKFSF